MSLSGMEHDHRLVVIVKDTVCSTLAEKGDPLFEQLNASVESSVQAVAQQSLQITSQISAADASSLKQELSSATTSVKTLAAQLSEDKEEIPSMLIANAKENRRSIQR